MHGWGHQYVHNHAATNGLSLYLAGLVLEQETLRIRFENESLKAIDEKV